MSRIKTSILSFLLLFLGACIYAFFRENIVFLNLIQDPFIPYKVLNGDSISFYIIRYCLPDALWYGALLLIQHKFLTNNIVSKICLYVSIILPFFIETLQYLHILSGTFDCLDILSYLLTLILFLCFQKKI